jgi:putative ABC transport system ATP-binding protein
MIRVHDLVKTFGPVRALGPVSFAVPGGAQVALLGESGSGKSTLLNLLGCMETPSRGAVDLWGQPTAGLGDAELCRLRLHAIGYVHQFFDLVSDLTALENVMVPLWLAGVARAAGRAEELLASLGLGHRLHQLASQLSGGEQQRVAIARALALAPRLLLADEPSGSLDSQTGTQVVRLLSDSARRLGATLIMATHSQAAAAQFPHFIRLKDGQLEDLRLPTGAET